jgi:16S rRNA (guanine1207-N2)-methyltransferase
LAFWEKEKSRARLPMRSARLEMALNTGASVLPETGKIAVIRPRIGDDLSILPKERVQVITGFRPDFDYFSQQGWSVAPDSAGPLAAAIVCLPRAKADARALLAHAAQIVDAGGSIIVDGQKTDGVDSIYKDLRALVSISEALAKAHGKIFSFVAGPAIEGWQSAPKQNSDGFVTCPGVFSADRIDRGSALLAAALPAKLPARVVDLGAGWGYLSQAILSRDGVSSLDLVEAEDAALACARLNITDPRATFHWADATTFRPSQPVGAVVCNPPFHATRDADPALGIAFLVAAHRMLSGSGVLYLVANRLFREVEGVGGDSAFKLTRAAFPIRAKP